MDSFRNFLEANAGVEIGPPLTREIEALLQPIWDEFPGGGAGGMRGYKLDNRMEEVQWDSISLTFRILRHPSSGTASKWNEIQYWRLDLKSGHAYLEGTKKIQGRSSQPKLDVIPIVDQLVEAITTRSGHRFVLWQDDGTAKLLIAKIIPSTGPKSTVTERRKRLKRLLSQQLEHHRWRFIASNILSEIKPS